MQLKLVNLKNKNFFEYNILIYFIGKILSALINIISIPLFIRWFGEENYGTYILAYTTFLVFLSGTLGWLNQSIIKFYTCYQNDLNFNTKIESITFKISVLGSILLGFVLLLFNQIQLSTLPIVVLAYIFACFYTNKLVLTQVKYKSKDFVISEFIRQISSLLLVYFLNDLTTLRPETILFSGIMISFAFGYLYVSKAKLPGKEILYNKNFDKKMFKEFLLYGIPIGLWMSLSPSANMIDRYLLGSYMGVVAIAQYTALYDIVFKIFTQLSTPIATIVQPMLMNTFNKGDALVYRKVRNKAGIYLLCLFVPTFFFLIYFDDYIITKYLGFTDLVVVSKLKKIIGPVAISSLFWQIAILLQRKIEATGKSYLVTLIMILVLVISSFLIIIFLPNYGFEILGYVALFTSFLYLLLIILLSIKKH